MLSNEALKNMRLLSGGKSCPYTGVEDLDVGRCLRKIGVSLGESIDGNKKRFHVESVQNHFNNVSLGWLKGYSQHPYLSGYDCCSDSTISFHRQSLEEMKLMKRLWTPGSTFKEFFEKFMTIKKH